MIFLTIQKKKHDSYIRFLAQAEAAANKLGLYKDDEFINDYINFQKNNK